MTDDSMPRYSRETDVDAREEETLGKEDIAVIIDGKPYPQITKNPLDEISLTSYILGILLGTFLGLAPYLNFKNFNLYIIALSTFHFLEFYITARYNPGKVHSESFLINNGKGYVLAHAFAILETLLQCFFFPNWKSTFYSAGHLISVILGLLLIVLGQLIRSFAMITAGKSFSHIVKTTRNPDHELVTNGIYSWFRHPSYLGFFWWALGTQLLLLNPLSFILFAIVLWKFFSSRIQFEERFLVQFFGEEYVQYQKRVSVWIPFIG